MNNKPWSHEPNSPTPSPTTPTHKEEQPFSMLLKIATIIQSNINPHNETLTPWSTNTQSQSQSQSSQFQFNTTITTTHPLTNHQKMKPTSPTTRPPMTLKSSQFLTTPKPPQHNIKSTNHSTPITTSQTTTTPRTPNQPDSTKTYHHISSNYQDHNHTSQWPPFNPIEPKNIITKYNATLI